MQEEYIKSIVSICDKKTQKVIALEKITIEKIIAKYSNTKAPIFKLVIDSKAISRNNDLLVKYKCLTCEIIQEITLNLFMRKVNRDIRCCDTCKNKSESKRTLQSQFMKGHQAQLLHIM